MSPKGTGFRIWHVCTRKLTKIFYLMLFCLNCFRFFHFGFETVWAPVFYISDFMISAFVLYYEFLDDVYVFNYE